MDQKLITAYWDNFAKSHQIKAAHYEAWGFGYEKTTMDELAALVVAGKKTATTSAFELYSPDEYVPQVGDYNIILNGSERPVCITQTKVVQVVPFRQVMAEHAYLEGEGDRSYDYWRQVHIEFFSNEYAAENKIFTEDALVLCELFEVVQ